jgi:hypothetical protein
MFNVPWSLEDMPWSLENILLGLLRRRRVLGHCLLEVEPVLDAKEAIVN